jgi:four helix bundle protein
MFTSLALFFQSGKQNENESAAAERMMMSLLKFSESPFLEKNLYLKITNLKSDSIMFEFQKLEVYKKAKTFHTDATELITTIKPNKTVKDQLSRASFSIVLNIAEGSGRFSKPDRRNFFVIARGSVFECVAILDVLHDLKSIDEPNFHSFLKKADELSRILFAMVKNLGN